MITRANKIESEMKAHGEQASKLSGLIERVEKESTQRLAELQRQLPVTILEWGLGEAERHEVDQLRAEIRRTQAALDDLPALFEHLQNLQAKKGRCSRLLDTARNSEEQFRKALDDARALEIEIGGPSAEHLLALAGHVSEEARREAEEVIKRNKDAALARRKRHLEDSGQAFRMRMAGHLEPDEAA